MKNMNSNIETSFEKEESEKKESGQSKRDMFSKSLKRNI